MLENVQINSKIKTQAAKYMFFSILSYLRYTITVPFYLTTFALFIILAISFFDSQIPLLSLLTYVPGISEQAGNYSLDEDDILKIIGILSLILTILGGLFNLIFKNKISLSKKYKIYASLVIFFWLILILFGINTMTLAQGTSKIEIAIIMIIFSIMHIAFLFIAYGADLIYMKFYQQKDSLKIFITN